MVVILNESITMKRYLYILLCTLFCISCETTHEGGTSKQELVDICIIADAEECKDSRVTLDGNSAEWILGDRIKLALTSDDIKYAELEIKSTGDISEDGKRAKFRGQIPVGSYYGVTALYPATEVKNDKAVLDRNAEHNIFMMAHIKNQTSPVLTVEANKSAELALTFKHLMHKMDFDITLDKDVTYETIGVEISATSNGTPIMFTGCKTLDFKTATLTANGDSCCESVMVSSTKPSFSAMLFPMAETDNVAFTFGIYLDGEKVGEVRKPENGTLEQFAMHEGKTTTVSLDISSNAGEYTMTCNGSAEAKGIWADVKFENIAYLVGNEPQEIVSLRLEYARADSNAWIGCDFTSQAIINGVFEYRIPFEGEEYLEENSKYACRITLYPKDSNNLKPLTSEPFEFTTKYAEVTANITTPTAEVRNDNVCVDVASAKVYFDGLDIPNYGEIAYEFAYRKSGSNLWESLSSVEFEGNGFSGTYDVTLFEEGATYEIIGRVTVNSTWVFDSEAASITIPNGNTPPTPPITGDADTTELAGEWHLTSWRGAAPSFDVYLSITEDGVVTLHQRMTSRLWETYYSTVGFENGLISGVYADGVAWGASYSVTMSENTMTWTDTTDSTDVSVYTRCTLPDFESNNTRAVINMDTKRFL